MAGAIVNVVVEQLILAAQHWVKNEISLVKGVKPELENMKNKMLIIQTVVEDAENQSVRKSENKIVKLWLEKLQDVSYDMDDVLDEWSTRVLILKREEGEDNNIEIVASSSSTSATTCFSLKKLNCFSSVKQLPWRREIALRIKNINGRIDSVFLDMELFKLAKKVVGYADVDKVINRVGRTTTSLIDESKVYGRDIDKKSLLSKVLSMNTEEEKSLQVISIVGAGGLGKTTLAQMVYNDEKVKEKFGEKRIWVCVSDPFDEFQVARHILEGLNEDHTKMDSLQTLHQSVEISLSGHKFFLVLDDVWDEHFQKWEKLRKCLEHSDPNSKILVTTRNERVAIIMGTTSLNILKPHHISDLDCWFLMSRIAFQGRTNTDNELEVIGKKIAKKCKGLPLAAKTLGGMLIAEDSVDRWREILTSEIWKLEEAKVDLFPHIFLSYQELPAVLKRCFLILAIFPKDTKFEDKEVIAIWMAHGFLIPRTEEDDDIVKTGVKYLKFLVSRCLLEEKRYSRISMHDIMHDFALHLSGDELISIDTIKNDIDSKSTSEGGSRLKSTTTRHLYIERAIDPASIGFDVGKLRTCIIRKVGPNVTSDLVKGFKLVRTLYLVGCDMKKVPPSIENLMHLRLLDLSGNPLVELPVTVGGLYNLHHLSLRGCRLSSLPNSIGKLTNLLLLDLSGNGRLVELPGTIGSLYNLQQLLLKECDLSSLPNPIGKLFNLRLLDLRYNRRLVELPETIGGLFNLQHLLLLHCNLSSLPNSIGKLTNLIFLRTDYWKLKKFPESVGKLINLQGMDKVQVGAGKNKLELLKDLNQLRRVLEIYFRSDYGDEVDAKEAAIERKKHITKLVLYFNWKEVTDGVMEALQPHSNIQFVSICDLRRSCGLLPSWITSLHHLTELQLNGGGNVSTLPPFGKLRSLKKLHIQQFNALKMVGREFMGIGSKPEKNCSAFLNLVELRFINCKELVEFWFPEEEEDSIIVMPNLEILEFLSCYKLGKLPRRLLGQTSLKEIKTISVDGSYRVSQLFAIDDYWGPYRVARWGQDLKMIVEEGSTKVPTSINYRSYLTLLLDIYCAEQPISYLPPMGKLPYLQSLKIRGFSSLEVIGREFLGIDDPNNDEDFVAFPNLLKFKISGCLFVREWEDLKAEDEGKVTVMPKLQFLKIEYCSSLQVLPSRLLCGVASLEKLRCAFNYNDSLAENIKKDEQLLRHVKSVYVNGHQCSLHPSNKSEKERESGI